MFCGFCGTNLPDGAEFCSNCGRPVVGPRSPQEDNTEDKINTEEMGRTQGNDVSGDPLAAEGKPVDKATSVQITATGETDALKEMDELAGNGVPGNPGKAGLGNGKRNRTLGSSAGLSIDKKKLVITGMIAVAAIIAVIAGYSVYVNININREITRLEDAIYSISASGFADEDEIIRLYGEYDSLSDSSKRKVANREMIINAYRQLEALIAQRKQSAAQVDAVIDSIDYSNIFAEASTVKDAVRAFNNLDDKSKEYLGSYEKLLNAYNEVKDMKLAVTEDNFFDIFIIEYEVGEHVNYGGTTVSQSGYTINWDRYGGSVTPNYDIDEHNDYATPVYVYVTTRYPALTSECIFHINLHQTYTGIGLVDSDVHEFKLQSANIQYDSSQEVSKYRIYVEDNDASSGLWTLFGMSYDWNDMVHRMNPFDVSRVEISSVDGFVSY